MEDLIRMYALRTYTLLIQTAAERKTLQAQDVVSNLELTFLSDTTVKNVLNSVCEVIDKLDDSHSRPRLTGLIIKRRCSLPPKRWFESYLKHINSSSSYLELGAEQRNNLWQVHIELVYDTWNFS